MTLKACWDALGCGLQQRCPQTESSFNHSLPQASGTNLLGTPRAPIRRDASAAELALLFQDQSLLPPSIPIVLEPSANIRSVLPAAFLILHGLAMHALTIGMASASIVG